jgi:hypothetical protein
MESSADKHLLHDLAAVGALVEHDRPSADERLVAAVGPGEAQALRSVVAQAHCAGAARRRRILAGAAARFSRLKQWQWSVFVVALGCGAAVAMMGVIELVWQFRSVLSGLAAVALVLTVFLKTRQHRLPHSWIGS